MISIKCPHCNVGLKVDERKLPSGINSFKCPQCKKGIPISLLYQDDSNDSDTLIVQAPKKNYGKLTVLPNPDTPEQVIPLYEGSVLIGRQSKTPSQTIGIVTKDKSMSREHIRIEVKKDAKGGYKHYLSDNNSKNHTLYNSNYLENGEVVVLNDNDEIILGHTILRFNE